MELIAHGQWLSGPQVLDSAVPPHHRVVTWFQVRPTVDLFSSDEGASGSLKLDAYDLAGGACSVSVECVNCFLVWGSDVAVVDGLAVESCL